MIATTAAVSTSRSGTLRAFVTAGAGNCLANVTWWMQPILMHYLVTGRSLSEPDAGMLLTLEMGIMAAASAATARLFARFGLPRIALSGMVIILVAGTLTLWAESFASLLLCRALAGAGAGAVLMVSNTLAARFTDPDKAFARIGLINILFGTLLIAALPLVSGVLTGSSPFLVMVIATGLLLGPVVQVKPVKSGIATEPAPTVNGEHPGAVPPGTGLRIGLLVAATFCVGITGGIVWAFFSFIGEGAGLSIAATDSAIAIAIFTAMGGTGVAAVIGGTFGRVKPMAIGLVLMTSAILTLTFHPTPLLFRVATATDLAALYFLLPYLFGAASAQDDTGRGAAYVGSAFYLAGALSPLVGGVLMATVGIEIVGVVAVIGAFFVGAVGVYVNQPSPRPREQTCSGALIVPTPD